MKRFILLPAWLACVLGFIALGTGCSDHDGTIHEDRTVFVQSDRPVMVDRHVYHDDDDVEIEIDD
jgi:hypothetical protein